MSHKGNVPLSGMLNTWKLGIEFSDILLAVCRTGKTGILRFRGASAEKSLVIKEGRILFARSSSTDDRLGPYLLRAGKIRFDHLIDLSRHISPTKRFGTVLVENGVLKGEDLAEGVIGQIRAIVMSLFRWTEAGYGFTEQELDKETITLRIPTSKLVVDGVRQVTSWQRVTSGIGSLDAVYQTTDSGERASSEHRDLTPAVMELLSDLRGPKTIAEACAGSDLKDFEVCQLLWAFSCLDWIGPVTERPSSS